MTTITYKDLIARVRFYNVGMGECTLIQIPTKEKDGTDFNIMVDCGSVNKEGDKKFNECIKDLRKSVNKIDLLIITHPHWDRISGFIKPKMDKRDKSDQKDNDNGSQFMDLEIERIWFPWTLDPNDEKAKKFRKSFKIFQDIVDIVLEMNEECLNVGNIDCYEDNKKKNIKFINGVSQFFGKNNYQAIDRYDLLCNYLPNKANSYKNVEYLKQGKIKTFKEIPNVRFYILGPSYNNHLKELSKNNPLWGYKKNNVDMLNEKTTDHFLKAVKVKFKGDLKDEDKKKYQEEIKLFDEKFKRDIKQDRFINFKGDSRNIEDHWWLNGTRDIAFNLDMLENNTSLAFAMEFTDCDKVMLFTGDAQAGCWPEWNKIEWKKEKKAVANGHKNGIESESDKELLSLQDLFAKTVLYKVGHYGSFNGTLITSSDQQLGLDKLNNQDLVTVISVDRSFTKSEDWLLPNPDMEEMIRKQAKSKVLFTDVQAQCDKLKEKVFNHKWVDHLQLLLFIAPIDTADMVNYILDDKRINDLIPTEEPSQESWDSFIEKLKEIEPLNKTIEVYDKVVLKETYKEEAYKEEVYNVEVYKETSEKVVYEKDVNNNNDVLNNGKKSWKDFLNNLPVWMVWDNFVKSISIGHKDVYFQYYITTDKDS